MNMMTMVAVPDGNGGMRHEPTPFVPKPAGKRKAPIVRDPMQTAGEGTADRLRLLIERIERLEEEKRGISDDIKDVYGEAKSTGFDPSTMRAIVRLRGMEKHHRDEARMMLETYMASLGL